MELLILIPTVAILIIYIAYREWLNVAYRQWLAELDLFKKRLSAYEELKTAIASLRTEGAVSDIDAHRFAKAMSNMHFLFDKDLERFVSGIYGALIKKHALDILLKKVDHREMSPTDSALTESAHGKSRELSSRITNGIYRDMPKRMEKYMRPESLSLYLGPKKMPAPERARYRGAEYLKTNN